MAKSRRKFLRDKLGRFVSPKPKIPQARPPAARSLARNKSRRGERSGRRISTKKPTARLKVPARRKGAPKHRKRGAARKRLLLRAPVRKEQEEGYDLCDVSERRRFYKDVSLQHDEVLLKSREARRRGLFVYMNIGLKKARGKQKIFGERRFRDLDKFRKFLAIGREKYVDWTVDNGLCVYEKTAGIAITSRRDKRRVIKKTFKKFKIVQPNERKIRKSPKRRGC